MTVRSIAAEQLRIEENLQRIATQIRVEIEREIEVTAALLSVLATSHNLQTGALQLFHDHEPTTVAMPLGRIVAFPSYVLHRVTPVTKGLRRTLAVWVSGPPYR